MINFFKRWFKRIPRRKKISRVVVVDSMTAVPEELRSDIYFIRRDGFDKRVAFACPCGCGRRIDLNLIRTQKPSWTAQLKNGKISLTPSVWLTADVCQSHFFIRNSKIEWVRDI